MEQFNPIRIIFFGSTDDSVIVLSKLSEYSTAMQQFNNVTITSVVTQPPRPVGREQILTPTPVEVWAKEHTIPVLSFPADAEKSWLYQDEKTVTDALEPCKADLIVSACYGQKIPYTVITDARYGGLNVHPSLLPRWRGADPMPWVIVSGDRQTGVTIVTLSEKFDEGKIIAQQKISVKADATPDNLRAHLFILGADLLCSHIQKYIDNTAKGVRQNSAKATYARRLTRQDGFIPWELLQKAVAGENVPPDRLPKFFQDALKHSSDSWQLASVIERAMRALSPWPGLWTEIAISDKQKEIHKKRLKILSIHLSSNNATMQQSNNALVLDTVQLEGKTPVSWDQFQKAYLLTSS